MIDETLVNLVIANIGQLGSWAVFVLLYIKERNDHNITREQHRADLREIAGITRTLPRRNPEETQH